jgi:hypothetical protein
MMTTLTTHGASLNEAASAVIKCRADDGVFGRAFIVETADERRWIITAAHCLPQLPPAHPASYLEERTYRKLFGDLRDPDPALWAECVFAEPVSDVAVFREPDGQALYDECELYESFVANRTALRIRPAEQTHAYVMNLAGEWIRTEIKIHSVGLSAAPTLAITTPGAFAGGMSGSPILSLDGYAVGVVSCDELNPQLAAVLPGWMKA